MRAVEFTGDLKQGDIFMRFPGNLYKGDPNWAAPDRAVELKTLFENEKLKPDNHLKILFYDNAALKARALVYIAGGGKGCIGFLEFADDYGFFSEAMGHCLKWLKSKGADHIWAPVDIDTWHRYRYMTSGFGEKTFTNEPYNKPYYGDYLKRYGFNVLEGYHSKVIRDYGKIMSRLKPKYERGISEGYSTRSMDFHDFDNELKVLYSLSMEIFRDNLGFTEISEPEFRNLYLKIRGFADPELILFAVSPQGKDVGFAFAYPDMNFILNEANPVFKALKFFAYRSGYRYGNILDLKTVGILKEHRGTRLGSVLQYRLYEAAIKKGFKVFNHCLMRDNNSSSGFDAGVGVKNKEYCLYEKRL